VPEYISVPIDTDPDVLATDAFEFLQDNIVGWLPQEGNFEVWLIEALSRMTGQLRDVTSMVPTSIFRYFGYTLMNIPPVDASQATGFTTWTVADNLGYTIPDGTQITMRDSSGTDHPFVTNGDVIIEAGTTSTAPGEVLITAVNTGADSSGLTNPVTLIDVLGFVSTVTIVGQTTGGVDAQSDADYLNHLVEQLQLMAPRPILAPDFAAMAKNVPGVYRATAIDGLKPAANEVQQLAIDATGGTFTVTFGANTTAALAYNITAAALQTALAGLASIGAGNVAVSGGPGNAGATAPYVVTFIGTKAGADQPAMTTSAVSLTGSAHTAAVSTLTPGAAAAYNVERYVSVCCIDEEGQSVSTAIQAQVNAYLDSHREVNFVVPIINPVYTMIDVQTTVKPEIGADPNALQTNVVAAINSYLSPAMWGVPSAAREGGADPTDWVEDNKIRYLEMAQVINNVPGCAYIVSLQTAVHNGSPNVVDITMPGDVPLPLAGSIVVATA
jgi:hypothetical protein